MEREIRDRSGAKRCAARRGGELVTIDCPIVRHEGDKASPVALETSHPDCRSGC
jgi:hypothetical protein